VAGRPASGIPFATVEAMPRVQRRFLARSRWTSVAPIGGASHFEVVEVWRDRVTLRAVLTGGTHEVEIGELDDQATWQLGWHSRVR
jgi:tryptophan-rich hypothetical protein